MLGKRQQFVTRQRFGDRALVRREERKSDVVPRPIVLGRIAIATLAFARRGKSLAATSAAALVCALGARRRAGNLAQRIADALAALGLGEIGQRQDADQPLVAVEHRQPTNLQLAHVLRDVGGILVLVAVPDVTTHHLAHRRPGPLAFGDGPHGDVAVGDGAEQAIIVADRQQSGIDRQHHASGVLDGVIGTNDTDVACHDFAHLHDLILGCDLGADMRRRGRLQLP